MKKLTNYPEVDADNLQLMYDYLIANYERIKDKFDMTHYRAEGDDSKHECNTVGCLLGWGVGGLKNTDVERFINNERINFYFISIMLLGIDINEGSLWSYLFSAAWSDIEGNNTLEAGINRIKTILDDIDYRSTPEWKLLDC